MVGAADTVCRLHRTFDSDKIENKPVRTFQREKSDFFRLLGESKADISRLRVHRDAAVFELFSFRHRNEAVKIARFYGSHA